MSQKHKVLWSEGLFLRPQHFQQHDRYLESFVEGRCRSLHNHSWGFTELVLASDQLSIGKVAIARACGVFPDGTPFNIPEVDSPPPAIDINESHRDLRVHLAIPVRREGEPEYGGADSDEGLARYTGDEVSVRDAGEYGHNAAQLRVGKLRTRLLLDNDQRDDYACLGVAQIIEAKADRSISIETNYIPPMLDAHENSTLERFVRELQGLLHHRGEALANQVAGSGQGGAAEISQFMLLQSVNRYEPVIAHLASLSGLHPEELFRALLEVAGDLSTMNSGSRRPPDFPPYNHDELSVCFQPVCDALRESLGQVIEQRAVRIPLKEPRFNLHPGLLTDKSLLESSEFVLAVRADMPSEELRTSFPPQSKVGSVETIQQMVNSGIAGIPITPLPVAPRQIPYHADFVYFRLERSSEYWPDLRNSGGFAIHVVGAAFPGLDMQFWAIKK